MKLSMKSFFSNSLFGVVVMFVFCAMLGGCASSSTAVGMTPTAIQTIHRHTESVTLAVGGGQETSSIGKSQISDTAFAEALSNAIISSKVFSSVIKGNGGDTILTATIFNIDQPSFGFSFTVKMEVGWTLKRANTGAILWQESIRSEHTATTSDALAGVARLRLANEGAAKNNIAEALRKISALDF